VHGTHRFLARLWRIGADIAEQGGPHAPLGPLDEPQGDDRELLRKAHWAIEKVTSDMSGRFAFNTAIAAVMELTNDAYRLRDSVQPGTLHFAVATAASLIFPFAPHTGSEVYELLTGARVWEEPWPEADLTLLEREVVEVVIQVNGKLRDRLQAPPLATREELEAMARERPKVQQHVNGRDVVKVIVVPGKLVNFVVR
jgi:leucyl-tRNA synthetase